MQNPKQNQRRLPQNQQLKNNPTSWGKVASWYDEYLQDEDTYQAKVIAPNLVRLLSLDSFKKDQHILELGCGQGYFLKMVAGALKGKRVRIEGVDLSQELLDIAKKELDGEVVLTQADAVSLSHIASDSQKTIYSVLALQNMSDLDAVMQEVKRVLSADGQFLAVLNHPAFRVPKQSDWYTSAEKNAQGRVVYTYMSDKKFVIDMHPGQSALGGKKEETYSFHHPLQYYAKIFSKHGLCISRIEEWISHKVSEEGPKKRLEDEARKEIPMFMCLEIKKLSSSKTL